MTEKKAMLISRSSLDKKSVYVDTEKENKSLPNVRTATITELNGLEKKNLSGEKKSVFTKGI